ncbi:TraB/GumN family protein [Symbiopectobacterium purcellii]|uniref:TraB/GumN family protein n=1 Tax=Symbiopectobacterium purcellii TaxID=2871826 RepID=A0ABX9AWZ5_9ENTR|nr:TraB/GumN family protein [Symbiopectobacterium purcellii]QZN97959.1 TraB/GumN family protein [Symbiopectobacterium purcellii]
MMTLLRQLATWLGLVSPVTYAYPALDVSLINGGRLHLVGSIHMGSQAMSPLPEVLLQQLQQSTALVVEADISDMGSPLQEEYEPIPLAERLDPERYQQFQQHCEALALNLNRVEHLPAWHAALTLQAMQAQSLGLRPHYGIDYQLIQVAKAANIPVIELEGQQEQLAMLRQLPQGGVALLEDTLDHWHVNARLLQVMTGWWLEGPPAKSAAAIPATFSHALSEVLMRQRNTRWRDQLQALPSGQYVVAVGALHLYGDNSLPSLLQPDSTER